MKKTTLVLFLIYQIVYSQSNTRYISKFFEFKPNQTEYLFADNVKLRDAPTLNSNVIELLKINTPLKIVEKTDKTLNYENIKSYWYKVSINNKIGYVLGALISVDNFSTINENFKFQIQSNSENETFLKVRIVTKNDVKEHKYKLIGDGFSLVFKDGQGLKNLDNMIIVNYLAEACGVENGESYIFWNNNKLYHIADLSSMVDGDAYHYRDYFIFPKNEDGVKGKIVHVSEVDTLEDESTNWRKSTMETRELVWDGEKLNPNLQLPKRE